MKRLLCAILAMLLLLGFCVSAEGLIPITITVNVAQGSVIVDEEPVD